MSQYVEAKLYSDDGVSNEIDGECYLFYADLHKGFVMTNCGDSYYDYDISFDDFIKFADFIREHRKDNHDNK